MFNYFKALLLALRQIAENLAIIAVYVRQMSRPPQQREGVAFKRCRQCLGMMHADAERCWHCTGLN